MNIEKEKRAIEYLRAFEPKTEPYYLCYKDFRPVGYTYCPHCGAKMKGGE